MGVAGMGVTGMGVTGMAVTGMGVSGREQQEGSSRDDIIERSFSEKTNKIDRK